MSASKREILALVANNVSVGSMTAASFMGLTARQAESFHAGFNMLEWDYMDATDWFSAVKLFLLFWVCMTPEEQNEIRQDLS